MLALGLVDVVGLVDTGLLAAGLLVVGLVDTGLLAAGLLVVGLLDTGLLRSGLFAVGLRALLAVDLLLLDALFFRDEAACAGLCVLLLF